MPQFQGPKGKLYSHWSDWRHAHPARHWKQGRSAMLLAQSWGLADALPWRVKLTLEKDPQLTDLEIDRARVEHETSPPGQGLPSCTDLMVWARNKLGSVALGVEGKVSEDFGGLVADWLAQSTSADGGANRSHRVTTMANDLGLAPGAIGALRYQLIHRTWAVLETARQAEIPTAVMLVHSFLPAGQHAENHFPDFKEFAEAFGSKNVASDAPVHVGQRKGVELWLCWVSDAGGVL